MTFFNVALGHPKIDENRALEAQSQHRQLEVQRGLGVSGDTGSQHGFRLGQPLNVINVRVSCDQVFAVRQREVELADHLDDFFDGVDIANVDHQPLILVVNNVHITSNDLAQLVIDFKDVGEDRFFRQHGTCSLRFQKISGQRLTDLRMRFSAFSVADRTQF